MAAFSYITEVEPFDYGAEAEMFFARGHKPGRQSIINRRFVRAVDAVRFAIEELAPELLPSAYLEVDEERYGHKAIRRLYERADYPLVRRATA